MELYNKNNINILLQKEAKTPRYSVDMFFKVNKGQKYFGITTLLARLLLQGTKKYSSQALALEFENNCIDISIIAKKDYIKASLSFLNEDFKYAMELLKELLINSTFDEFEKEVFKLRGEIIADLDNPRFKLSDMFTKSIFKFHPYSSCHTKILEDLDKIKKEDITEAHKNLFNSQKAIVLVGDFEDENEIINYFENEFSFMKNENQQDEIYDLYYNDIKEDEIIKISKNDASQAQIIQGWLVDSFKSEYCAKYTVLNNILGASGLSSRLFVNLRDKQGLAYTVRSHYETMLHSAIFSMYIGTTPKNIQKSLEGFEIELQKLASNPPDEKELQGAKENISGRYKYFSQNNSQISSRKGYDFMMGLGLNYDDLFLDDVNHVSAQDVSNMAQKLLSMPKLITIIAPDEK